MHSAKRPKSSETEEEILKQEQEFLQALKEKKIVPSAKVKKVTPVDPSPAGKGVASTSSSAAGGAEDGGGKMEVGEGRSQGEGAGGEAGTGVDIDDGDPMSIEHPVEAVLFQVKEKAFDPSRLQGFSGSKASPEVVKVKIGEVNANSSSLGPVGSKRKKSLFARSFDARQESRRKGGGGGEQQQQPTPPKGMKMEKEEGSSGRGRPMEESAGTSNAAGAGNSDPIGEKVHPLLAGMTEEDILLEQKRLLERLDPKLVDFIRKRSQQQPHPGASDSSKSANDQIKPQSMEVVEGDPVPEKDLPIDPKTVQDYPGMNKIELSKLAWAGVIKDPEPKPENRSTSVGSGSKSARFDFTGSLLPNQATEDASTYEKALHHHGEEMERPGYSLEELLTLGRSVNFQQRSIALETLGNIYARAHTGIYDEVLEQSLFHLLDMMEFIHVVRKGLDNNDSSSINCSLGCLAALLYVEHEEACLDATYLWPNTRPFPLLSTKPEEEMKKDSDPTGSEMKDSEYLQLDLLDFLINRSDILIRVEYLLMTKSELFNEKGVTSLLKIIIRLARHSPSTVMQHEGILKYVVENHISPNWITLRDREKTLKGIPLIHALKLVRVLIESSVSNAMKLYQNYGILPSVMSYLAYDQWKEQSHVEEVEDLVLESFKIWLSFLSSGIAIDEYISFFPIIMKFLQFYGVSDKLNSFDLLHSAYLFALLNQIVCFGQQTSLNQKNTHSHWNLVKDGTYLVEQHCYKLMKILSAQHLQGTFNIDLALLSLGKGLEFLTHSLRYSDKAMLSRRFQPVVKEFTQSALYFNLTTNLTSHSIILDDSPEKSRYSSNFATIGGIQWEGGLNPVMKSNSPFHFLAYFVPFCKSVCDTVFDIFYNDGLEKYLLKLQHHHPTSSGVKSDYFIRFELSCLHQMLSALPKEFGSRFPVAYKGLALVPYCCTGLFQNMLKCALETCCKPNDLDAVYSFYLAYFSLLPESFAEEEKSTKVRFDDGGHPGDNRMDDAKILFENWDHRRTEEHWMFHPLENLYKRAVGIPGYVKENLPVLEQEARGCLSFIQHCLRYYCQSIVQTSQDLVTVYCRLCRVFMLGSPHFYIDEVTALILQEILKILVTGDVLSSNQAKALFSQHKPSGSAAVSFYDFYTEFVNEYFDNSYFNETFAAYVLLPLRTGEDSRVKNCFWKHEHLHCIRITEDKVPFSVEYLTKYAEKDPKMLLIFTILIKRKVLVRERNPLLYNVTVAHLQNSVEFMTEELRSVFNLLKL